MNYADLFYATMPVATLEVAALLVLVVDLVFLRKAPLKTRVSVAAVLGIVGCGVAALMVPLERVGLMDADDLNILGTGGSVAFLQISILLLTILTLLLLIEARFTRHVGEYVSVVLMAASGGLIVVAAQDLLVIFIGLELMSLGLYILTAFDKSSGKSAEAALKYYLFGGMSAAFLLFGFSYIYGLSGSTNLCWIGGQIAFAGSSPLLYVAWICIVAGLGFKVAAVPFHLWAPDTYEGAPAPAAAFIASVSKVASFGLLLTFSSFWLMPGGAISGQRDVIEHLLKGFYSAWQPLAIILLILAPASMLVGNLAALAQVSVRRLLAYSAIAHAGYILLGVAVKPAYAGQSTAFHFLLDSYQGIGRTFIAVLYYVVTYGLTTIGAFGVVSVVERATGSDRLDSFLGLHKRNPLLAAVLLVLFLSLAGIPPLVGFWAKFNLFAAVLGVSAGPIPFALVALAVALSAVSLYYYLQVLKRAYVMPAIDETPIKAHPVTMAVLLFIASAVVVLGCFPALLQGWIQSFYPVL
jgi:NADH-quinone oxidoreductase subunit N